MSITLTFHGAAGCVTGFCARLQTSKANVLIDCGMFQGSKTLKELNYRPFPFSAQHVDAVLLTHAHIDHSGLLPKLMKAGFFGSIFATAGTRDLCAVMLRDAGHIQESEVRHLNWRNKHRGRPEVEPIYTLADAAPTLELFKSVKLGQAVDIAPGVSATYWEAGHMLGSASVEVAVQDGGERLRLLFSGDLGPGGRDFLPDPEAPSGIDYLILESTYGARTRPVPDPDSRRTLLAHEISEAHAAGGPLLIPAFAIERSQELLRDLQILMADGRIPETDVFLDSPLAIEATEVFQRKGWNRAAGLNPFAGLQARGRLKFLREPWESDRLERLSGWHIVMAASGMCDAGRVRRHLKRLLWRRDATVLLPGFQAQGTLGRLLVDGARRVTIQGEEIRVAARIRSLDVYSGHADADGLVGWAKARRPVQGDVFLAHGEPDALAALQARLIEAGFPAPHIRIPTLDAVYELGAASAIPQRQAARLAPAQVSGADWHNARTRLLLDLDAKLAVLASDAQRDELLSSLVQALGPVGLNPDQGAGLSAEVG